jgi:hypothetical protein
MSYVIPGFIEVTNAKTGYKVTVNTSIIESVVHKNGKAFIYVKDIDAETELEESYDEVRRRLFEAGGTN